MHHFGSRDFPVVSNELRFLTSTPHLGKEQPMPVDKSNLNSESNLNNKHSEIQDIGRFYQIIHLDILASTYSAIACPDCFNTSCVELKKEKKQGLSLQLCLSYTICEFR